MQQGRSEKQETLVVILEARGFSHKRFTQCILWYSISVYCFRYGGGISMTLSEIKIKTSQNKEARLQRIANLCNTDGSYKKNRKKPRAKAEQVILDTFAVKGYY